MRSVYLNIGSNRGERRRLLDEAVRRLAEAFGGAVIRTSPAVESEPWGFESDHPFLNIGVALDFADDSAVPAPPDILGICQDIERTMAPGMSHRNADGSYRDRLIDIDIIDIDGVTMDTPRLTVPHPRAAARSFVTGPMQVLCPGWSAARGGHLKKSADEMGRDSVAAFRAKEKSGICVVLDNVRSLNNIGSVFRTCDAFSADSVVLCGISAVPPSPAIHKTALGAEESVAWRYFADTCEAVRTLRQEGWRICCLEQVHGSTPLDRFVPAEGERIAIVAGNEVTGVDPAVVTLADTYLEIPQTGTKHSLNVAVSTAIALWHVFSRLHPSR